MEWEVRRNLSRQHRIWSRKVEQLAYTPGTEGASFPGTVWRKYAWLFCVPEAEVASSDLRGLDVTSSGFYEENRANECLCAQLCTLCVCEESRLLPSGFTKQKQEASRKKKYVVICLCWPIWWKNKLLKASLFSLSIFPVSGNFRYSFLNFLINVFFVIFCKCIKAKRKERWSSVKLFEIIFLTDWRKWSMNRKVVSLHWWNWSRSTIIIVCICYLTVNWLLLWIVYDF